MAANTGESETDILQQQQGFLNIQILELVIMILDTDCVCSGERVEVEVEVEVSLSQSIPTSNHTQLVILPAFSQQAKCRL